MSEMLLAAAAGLFARSFALPLGLGLARIWSWLHTLPYSRQARDDKRAERLAFYHDMIEDLKAQGYAPPDIGPQVLVNVIAGMPADIAQALAALWARLTSWGSRRLGSALFWLAIAVVIAIMGLRRAPRPGAVPEPTPFWPVDCVVYILCIVMLAFYGGALKRVPNLASRSS